MSQSFLLTLIFLTPLATGLLAGSFLDRFTLSRGGFSVFTTLGVALSGVFFFHSSRIVDLLILQSSVEMLTLADVVAVAQQVLFISSSVALVLSAICLLCELPLYWLQKNFWKGTTVRAQSLRPLLILFLISLSFQLIVDAASEDFIKVYSERVQSHG